MGSDPFFLLSNIIAPIMCQNKTGKYVKHLSYLQVTYSTMGKILKAYSAAFQPPTGFSGVPIPPLHLYLPQCAESWADDRERDRGSRTQAIATTASLWLTLPAILGIRRMSEARLEPT